MIGCHTPMHHSKRSQERLGADVVQICLGSPRKWSQTKLPDGEVASPIFVHAPYLINLSSANKEVLLKSRQTLWQQTLVAREIGALGVVIHGGSWKKHSHTKALSQWKYTFGRPFHVKVLIENSASGRHSLTRYLEDLEELWDSLTRLPDADVGFCLDTCHLWASGMGASEGLVHQDPTDTVLAIRKIVGKIDLVHANGSLADWGTGQDRHSPLHSSVMPVEWMRKAIVAAKCEYVVAESTEPADDIRDLRRLL